MEAIQKNIQELSQNFYKTMAEFQQNLQSAIPATSPTSNIAAQFSAFRNFVLSALKSLQGQVEILSRQLDKQETHSRRKILLFHGVPEVDKEDLSASVVKVVTQHLGMSDFSSAAISRCHRMGKSNSEGPRAILVKFCELTVRNKVWFGKKKLKGTGITVAEFLTKNQYEIFITARKQLGISKSWTKFGQVFVVLPDGKRQSVSSMAELSSISKVNDRVETGGAPGVSTGPAPKQDAGNVQRSKRQGRK